MHVSTKGRYAVQVMVDLMYEHSDKPTPLRLIAQRQGVSEKYLEQIVKPLVDQGFLTSTRGVAGGYALSADPQSITVGQILRAAEGDFVPAPCMNQKQAFSCANQKRCISHRVWQEIKDSVDDAVNSMTLASLVDSHIQ